MSMGLFLTGMLAFGIGMLGGQEDSIQQVQEDINVDFGAKRAYEMSKAKASTSECLTFPLPTTPDGPQWKKRYTRSNKSADVIVWRKPCADGSSFVLVTLKPVVGSPFICSPDAVIQEGVQFSTLSYSQDERGYDSICADIFVPVTGWLNVRSPVGFDPNKEFALMESDLASDQRINVPAFDPSLYDMAPPSAKITKDYSGSWFTDSSEIQNQGWSLVFNEELKMAIAYWFTGSADGKSLDWFTVVGEYSGDTAEMEIYKTKDVTFMGATGSTSSFGTFKIEFENCSAGVATYEMNDGRKGSVPIDRLIPAPAGCK